MVKVWDPTDKGYQPRGKQVSCPEGIWYTPVTGIWQTVWLEPVSKSYIQDLRITPDIDNSLLSLKALVKDATSKDLVEVKVFDGQQLVAQGKSINGECVQVAMPENTKLWSPESPFLYTLRFFKAERKNWWMKCPVMQQCENILPNVMRMVLYVWS